MFNNEKKRVNAFLKNFESLSWTLSTLQTSKSFDQAYQINNLLTSIKRSDDLSLAIYKKYHEDLELVENVVVSYGIKPLTDDKNFHIWLYHEIPNCLKIECDRLGLVNIDSENNVSASKELLKLSFLK